MPKLLKENLTYRAITSIDVQEWNGLVLFSVKTLGAALYTDAISYAIATWPRKMATGVSSGVVRISKNIYPLSLF